MKPTPSLIRISRMAFYVSAVCAAYASAGAQDPSQAKGGAVVANSQGSLDVRSHGATGNGVSVDTPSIQAAIDACAKAGGGTVEFPSGRYLSGTISLQSHVKLHLSAGAVLIGSTNLADYRAPVVPSFMPEAKWGKWHRALVIGEGLVDSGITGEGLIDGRRVFDPTGEEHMRGPHTIVFVGCTNFVIEGISILDSANYAVFFQASSDVSIRNVRISGGWDGVHFRGSPGHPCRRVNIIGCEFYTGDDSIAGRYWEDTVISGCIINSSCNGIRLIGPAQGLTVSQCLFYGPGRQPHRSSGRTNMLSGVILQPGAWDKTEGLLDDVFLTDLNMKDVACPLTIWTKPGNPVGCITVSGLNATRVYRSAMSVESWSDAPITNLVVRNTWVDFEGKATSASEMPPTSIKSPGVDARALPAWGFYARNVEHLSLQDTRLSVGSQDLRPVVIADRVGYLEFDGFKFTTVPEVAQPIWTNNVTRVTIK